MIIINNNININTYLNNNLNKDMQTQRQNYNEEYERKIDKKKYDKNFEFVYEMPQYKNKNEIDLNVNYYLKNLNENDKYYNNKDNIHGKNDLKRNFYYNNFNNYYRNEMDVPKSKRRNIYIDYKNENISLLENKNTYEDIKYKNFEINRNNNDDMNNDFKKYDYYDYTANKNIEGKYKDDINKKNRISSLNSHNNKIDYDHKCNYEILRDRDKEKIYRKYDY
jgi:hypothetical protein